MFNCAKNENKTVLPHKHRETLCNESLSCAQAFLALGLQRSWGSPAPLCTAGSGKTRPLSASALLEACFEGRLRLHIRNI